MVFEDLRRKMVGELLPATDYELAKAPEVCIYHWFTDDEKPESTRPAYADLWLPIRKREE